ncbi:unnamed protein product [Trifolium pratense]|uniref:Uncharacterized protein n=1 Tax=Trifolium pratense TaxID=57577 RepID=A0ACB0LVL5_TRIPR|nr:unnamed protein product [Trifolium pratense]
MADVKDSFMMEPKSSTTTITSSSQKHHRTFLMVQNILRIFVIVLTAVSIVVMVTNNQSFMVITFQIEAHFYYSSSLKFFVAANGVVCFLSVLRLIINLLMRKQTPQRKDYYFYIFLLDLLDVQQPQPLDMWESMERNAWDGVQSATMCKSSAKPIWFHFCFLIWLSLPI